MATTTKKEIIDRIADGTQIHRDQVREVVAKFLDVLIDEIGQGNRLEFREFGVFEVRIRAARVAQNPKTLKPVPVPEKRTVKFKAGRKMRERLAAAPAGSLVEAKPRRRARTAQEGEIKQTAPTSTTASAPAAAPSAATASNQVSPGPSRSPATAQAAS